MGEGLTALTFVALMVFAAWKFSADPAELVSDNRSEIVSEERAELTSDKPADLYSETIDHLKVVEQSGTWELVVHNSGPATDAVAFFYAPKQQEIYCQLSTHFSQDERRSVANICPMAATAAQTNSVDFVILSNELFEGSNWREVMYRETPPSSDP